MKATWPIYSDIPRTVLVIGGIELLEATIAAWLKTGFALINK